MENFTGFALMLSDFAEDIRKRGFEADWMLSGSGMIL